MSFFRDSISYTQLLTERIRKICKTECENLGKRMSSLLAQDIQTDALSDDALLAAIGAGDQRAAGVFIRRHGSYVLHICRSKLQNDAEAEEAVQDIFAAVWRNAGKWQPGGAKVTTWLYRIAGNRCIDILRRRRPTTDIAAIAEPVDETADVEAGQMAADRHRLISNALESLNQDQKRAIELVYFCEMKQNEAAEMMGIKLAALESVLRRARTKLHEELAGMRDALHMV